MTARNLLREAEERVRELERGTFNKEVKVRFGTSHEYHSDKTDEKVELRTKDKGLSVSTSRSRSAKRKFSSAELQRKSVPTNASKLKTGILNWQIETLKQTRHTKVSNYC